ncbi:MAG: hypothetical protein HWQ43_32540 [Nostoc sp. JL31]|uniref:hypothetical protein n=1 Tax=Nostoc sp. JL31 TaxID=2815395 RepID=UPI0025FB39CF|nr:hypothetical protein [Nostoc sp. JL31]MBN3893644.1 hypothetical protein [Nostoc sp. JL31]
MTTTVGQLIEKLHDFDHNLVLDIRNVEDEEFFIAAFDIGVNRLNILIDTKDDDFEKQQAAEEPAFTDS